MHRSGGTPGFAAGAVDDLPDELVNIKWLSKQFPDARPVEVTQGLLSRRCHDDDPGQKVWKTVLDLSKNLESVETREHEIQNHGVERVRAQLPECGLAIGDALGMHAGTPKDRGDQLANDIVIIDDKYIESRLHAINLCFRDCS